MDIKGPNGSTVNGTQRSVANRAGSANTSNGSESVKPTAGGDDSVSLSVLPDVIKSTSSKLAAEPSVDEAKVQRIKDAIANGEYPVDSKRLAQKLLEFDSL